ncbi:MAG: hypothetical protein IKP34_01060, partial [Bacteroidales bacterium]|nr:hypothetical protein [Bacteroidales bacterium]
KCGACGGRQACLLRPIKMRKTRDCASLQDFLFFETNKKVLFLRPLLNALRRIFLQVPLRAACLPVKLNALRRIFLQVPLKAARCLSNNLKRRKTGAIMKRNTGCMPRHARQYAGSFCSIKSQTYNNELIISIIII